MENIVAADTPLRGEIKQLILENKPLPESGSELLEIIKNCAQANNIEELPALIIVNKIEKAVRIYANLLKRIKEENLDIDVVLLHSRLRQGYRQWVEEKVERLQKRARNSNTILIATQVVEAGLDFDVSILLTEISPIDSLIQRIGRCARKRDGCVVIFTDTEAGKGVYLKDPMDITASTIEDREDELKQTIKDIKVAQDLVDAVYKKEVIDKIKKRACELGLKIGYVRNWTQNFMSHIFSRPAHQMRVPLLRVGREYLCWAAIKSQPPAVDYRTYITLASGKPITVNLEVFKFNLVKLSVKITKKGLKIPQAIIHEKEGNGEKVVILLNPTANRSNGRTSITLIPKFLTVDKLLLGMDYDKKIFLLNPHYYRLLTLNGKLVIELGVVKLFK